MPVAVEVRPSCDSWSSVAKHILTRHLQVLVLPVTALLTTAMLRTLPRTFDTPPTGPTPHFSPP